MNDVFVHDSFFELLRLYPRLLIEDMSVGDWNYLAGTILWFFLLCLPLKGIDRRDIPSGLLYGLSGALTGILLIFAIPENTKEKTTFPIYFVASFFFTSLFLIRWFKNHQHSLEINKSKDKEDIFSGKQDLQ